jgi:hypothetical protein
MFLTRSGLRMDGTMGRPLEPSPQREVIKASKRLVRLQARRRRTRRTLDVLTEEITFARRDLQAIMGAVIRDDTL